MRWPIQWKVAIAFALAAAVVLIIGIDWLFAADANAPPGVYGISTPEGRAGFDLALLGGPLITGVGMLFIWGLARERSDRETSNAAVSTKQGEPAIRDQ